MSGMEGQALWSATGRRGGEDIVVSVAIRGEGDCPAVGGPDRVEITRDVLGQRHRLASDGRDSEKVATMGEDDGLSIRRDDRRAEPLMILRGEEGGRSEPEEGKFHEGEGMIKKGCRQLMRK